MTVTMRMVHRLMMMTMMTSPRSVEDEEHDDSDNKYDGQVAVLLLLVHSISLGY